MNNPSRFSKKTVIRLGNVKKPTQMIYKPVIHEENETNNKKQKTE